MVIFFKNSNYKTFKGKNGVYTNAFDQFNFIFQDYKDGFMGLNNWEDKWRLKISWDNTDLFGGPSEGLFIQPMNVDLVQSPLHVREIARCFGNESYNNLSLLTNSSSLNDLVFFC